MVGAVVAWCLFGAQMRKDSRPSLVGTSIQKMGTHRVQMGAGRCVPSDFKPEAVGTVALTWQNCHSAKLLLDRQGLVRGGPHVLSLCCLPPH